MRIASLKINTMTPSTQPRWRENQSNYTTKPQTQTKHVAKITYIMAHSPAYRVAKKHNNNKKKKIKNKKSTEYTT